MIHRGIGTEFRKLESVEASALGRNRKFFMHQLTFRLSLFAKRGVDSWSKLFRDFPSNLLSGHRRYIGLHTFAFNHMIHGLDVTGYHIVNLLIHILNGLLVYVFVILVFKSP